MLAVQHETYRIERKHVLTVLGLLALTLVVEHLYGRHWWCSCGSWIPWSTDTNGLHNSQHFVDPYSVSHFEHGLFFFVLLYLFRRRLSLAWRLVCAVGIECSWELLENSSFIIDRYRAATVSTGYYGDSMLNSSSDVLFASLGFVVASLLPAKHFWLVWALIVIACELGLVFTIRDSLAINVIMLVRPVDAIRAWQAS